MSEEEQKINGFEGCKGVVLKGIKIRDSELGIYLNIVEDERNILNKRWIWLPKAKTVLEQDASGLLIIKITKELYYCKIEELLKYLVKELYKAKKKSK